MDELLANVNSQWQESPVYLFYARTYSVVKRRTYSCKVVLMSGATTEIIETDCCCSHNQASWQNSDWKLSTVKSCVTCYHRLENKQVSPSSSPVHRILLVEEIFSLKHRVTVKATSDL
jgi:hypothetical protein